MLREPFEIRGYSLANRIVAAPIASRSCELNGAPSEKTLDIYRRLADSGVGLAVAEHHAVHPWGRNRLAQLRLDSDQAAHSLIPLTQLFAERNLPLLAQINFAGNNIADESLLAQDDFRLLSASSIDKPDGNGARRPQEGAVQPALPEGNGSAREHRSCAADPPRHRPDQDYPQTARDCRSER